MVADREIRTCAPKTRAGHKAVENDLRLLSRVLREVATSQRFTSFVDLKVAYRRRLVELAIRYPQSAFDDAFGVVGSNLQLVHLERPPAARRVEHVDLDRGFTRAEARAFLADLPRLGPRAMPPVMGERR